MIKITQMPKPFKINEPEVNRALHNIALTVRTDIKNKTRDKGVDVYGNKFKEYAESTQKRKEKAGAPGFVNLTDHSNMINSVAVKPIPNGWAVYIADKFDSKKGYWHQTGSGKLPKREWFGVTRERCHEIYKKYGLKLKVFK